MLKASCISFLVAVTTILAGWNRKYFGAQRGITYYNFISDQFTGFRGIVVPGTIRNSLYILAGLLELNKEVDYGALNDLSRHILNEKLIAAHWEDMLRLAGSLKLGIVGAASVMRTLQRGGSLYYVNIVT